MHIYWCKRKGIDPERVLKVTPVNIYLIVYGVIKFKLVHNYVKSLHKINIKYFNIRKNIKMPLKLYKYGNDRLSMKVLKNVHEVIDFVNPNNENLRQSTIRQRIISCLKKGTLFSGAKPDPNRWKETYHCCAKDRTSNTFKEAP